ncbi:MAG: hypothetical protein ACPIOQ_57870 [Promethearchaeia archaeon]
MFFVHGPAGGGTLWRLERTAFAEGSPGKKQRSRLRGQTLASAAGPIRSVSTLCEGAGA